MELFSKNKIIAHNIFANPIFTLTFGVRDWTKEEIEVIDIKTRKFLTYTGNFHRKSSVDRLYAPRKDGGRRLNSIYDNFVIRIISPKEHLNATADQNPYLKAVLVHDQNKLARVANEFLKALNIESNQEDIINVTTSTIKNNHLSTYQGKDEVYHQEQLSVYIPR